MLVVNLVNIKLLDRLEFRWIEFATCKAEKNYLLFPRLNCQDLFSAAAQLERAFEFREEREGGHGNGMFVMYSTKGAEFDESLRQRLSGGGGTSSTSTS